MNGKLFKKKTISNVLKSTGKELSCVLGLARLFLPTN